MHPHWSNSIIASLVFGLVTIETAVLVARSNGRVVVVVVVVVVYVVVKNFRGSVVGAATIRRVETMAIRKRVCVILRDFTSVSAFISSTSC